MSLPLLKNTLSIIFIALCLSASGQIGSITLVQENDKPEKFKTRKLRSEKTGEKKFTLPRRIFQNTTTHYNYYFNANEKLKAVIDRSRTSNKDDYTKLIPFYGYSLENTASQATELDSVIYKATAGILLHDLRNDWVDNLYLLIGKAYLLRKDFDSASMTFQFINYNLFPRKKKGDDQLIVGTNDNAADRTISIANKEKRNIVQKTFTLPPSRNDALIWQARTLIEMGEYPDAAGLINTLHTDPNLPKRLRPDLEEVNSYWFYKQNMYDSAAVHLEKALSNAEDKTDKARWEFLLAQLYERTGNTEKAADYYARAIKHTVDPLLDIYARLNRAKMYKSKDPRELDNSIDNLIKMAKRDKFDAYQDILYYSAAELAMEKPDTALAMSLFKESIAKATETGSLKNKAFLQLGDIAFQRKDFRSAQSYYDSVQTSDSTLEVDLAKLEQRKNALGSIVQQVKVIEREDSLQRIAAMPVAERESFVKKLVRKLRKERGLKEDEFTGGGGAASIPVDNTRTAPPDLFAGSDKGDFYFYNQSLKAKGFTEFQSRWGKRANVDNWRTVGANDAALNAGSTPGIPSDTRQDGIAGGTDTLATADINVDVLTLNLPLTPEKLTESNKLLSSSLYSLGKLYQNTLEEYQLAIETYEQSLQRFPDSLYSGEIYMNLYYCYTKVGDVAKATYYKNLLDSRFKESSFSRNLATGTKGNPTATKNAEATKQYERIYNLFIEGNFEQALAEKRVADSLHGESYWSPQLLYIEAVYHVRQRNDSLALIALSNIVNNYPTSALRPKAMTLMDVVGRRSQIESYLTSLQVQRAQDDTIAVVRNDVPQPVRQQVSNADTAKTNVPTTQLPQKPIVTGPFTLDPSAAHHVVMVLDKVDPVFQSEARNALTRYVRERLGGVVELKRDALDKDRALVVFSSFKNAQEALDNAVRIKKDAAAELSWLPANKYSFIIISESNLQLLKQNLDLNGYRAIMNSTWPGKL
jgi:tetratricopeptide (TPR) repeat protein